MSITTIVTADQKELLQHLEKFEVESFVPNSEFHSALYMDLKKS